MVIQRPEDMFNERGMSDEPDDQIEYLKHENARARSAFARAKTIHCMERLQYLYSFVKSENSLGAEVEKPLRGSVENPERRHSNANKRSWDRKRN